MNFLFIVNPKARNKSCEGWLRQEILSLDSQFLKENHIEVKLTEYAGHAEKIAKEAADIGEPIRIYACGGDGTLNEVVNGLYGYDNAEIGIVPSGTGNDFVKTMSENMGMPQNNIDAFFNMKAQLLGDSYFTDLLQVNDKYSINVICAGFDAEVGAGVHDFSILPFVKGSMAYKLSVVRGIISKMKHDFTIIADGKEIKDNSEYLLTVAANGRYYGGCYNCTPKADLNDGYIDFLRVCKISRIRFMKLIGLYEKGTHLEEIPDICKLLRCKTLQICAEHPINLNIDGEILTVSNPVIKVIKDAVKIIYPMVKNKLSNETKRDTILTVNQA